MIYQDSTIVFQPIPKIATFKNLHSLVFSRLTVLGYAGKNHHDQTMWFCKCICGNVVKVRGSHLLSKKARSCGCYHRDVTSQNGTIHGMSASAEYRAYKNAKSRCNCPSRNNFSNYGGRGIEFRFSSFEEFFAEVGSKPSPQHSLDRFPDTNGHYEKGNLRWATRDEQNSNTRRTVFLTFNGVAKPITEWVGKNHLLHRRIWNRIRLGWCDSCAYTQPLYGKCICKSSSS